MRKTTFSGLTVLGPEDSIFADGAAFTTRDRDEIDRGLKIGIKTHRHTGLAGLVDPTKAPSAAIIASGGTIDSGVSITVGYTLEDAAGGETLISPLAVASTPVPLDVPLNAPVAVPNYTEGSLLIDSYTYGITYVDGEGGETPLGPTTLITRDPGFANAQMELSGLTTGLEEAGATGWRLFRARGGGEFVLLATGDGSEDTFTDDGSVSPDCDTHPPTDNVNTTNKINTLQVTIPSGLTSDATFINVYATTTGSFAESSLLAQYPIASAGAAPVFQSLEFLDSQPPDVNRSYGGADKIDPEDELLDFHWRRPVAGSGLLGSGSLGDVKLTTDTGELFGVLSPLASAAGPSEWTRLVMESPPVLIASAASGNPGSVNEVEKLTFVGSGNIQVTLAKPTPGEARITIMASGLSPITIFGSGSAAAGASVAAIEKLELIGSAGVNVKETEPSGKNAKVVLEGQAVTLSNEGMGVLICKTSEKGRARPKAFKQYTWYCKEKPTNMAEFDIWIEEGP